MNAGDQGGIVMTRIGIGARGLALLCACVPLWTACGGDEAAEVRATPTGQISPAQRDSADGNHPPELRQVVIRPNQPTATAASATPYPTRAP